MNVASVGGPKSNLAHMGDFRKLPQDDNSIKPTSSSMGPSRIK